MSGYVIQDLKTLAIVTLCLAVIPGVGFLVARTNFSDSVSRTLSWLLVLFAVLFVERISLDEPAGVRMIVLIVALLWSMKSVVAVEMRLEKGDRLNVVQWSVFVFAWPGMRPAPFTKFPAPALVDARLLAVSGMVRVLAGMLLIVFARSIYVEEEAAFNNLIAIGAVLIGISLLVHFGLFKLLCAALRAYGVNCKPLFRSPLQSTRLSEFWGRRWNLAFSEMTAISVYRPLRGAVGNRAAIIAAFVFSGLLHELAISVPVRSGFGLPLLYFSMHAAAMSMERRLEDSQMAIWKNDLIRRLWTAAWILCPLPILFHPAFIKGCVIPLLNAK